MKRAAAATSARDQVQIFKIFDRGQWKEAKACAQCLRTFTNRRKWRGKFEDIKFCSDRCRNDSKASPPRET
jgi:hypothetical protein